MIKCNPVLLQDGDSLGLVRDRCHGEMKGWKLVVLFLGAFGVRSTFMSEREVEAGKLNDFVNKVLRSLMEGATGIEND